MLEHPEEKSQGSPLRAALIMHFFQATAAWIRDPHLRVPLKLALTDNFRTELQVNRLEPHPVFQSLKKPSLTALHSSPGDSGKFPPPRLDCILQSQARRALEWGGLLVTCKPRGTVCGRCYSSGLIYGEVKAGAGTRAGSTKLFPLPCRFHESYAAKTGGPPGPLFVSSSQGGVIFIVGPYKMTSLYEACPSSCVCCSVSST